MCAALASQVLAAGPIGGKALGRGLVVAKSGAVMACSNPDVRFGDAGYVGVLLLLFCTAGPSAGPMGVPLRAALYRPDAWVRTLDSLCVALYLS